MITIVIPARHEIYLQQTIDDIFAKATGEVEVIVVFDNYWPAPSLADHPQLTTIHWGKRRGMRAAINAAADIGKGEYLMKVDAHCMFSEGFDEILKANCGENTLITPRRYSLDAENWMVKKDHVAVDYEYLAYPYQNGKDCGLHGHTWPQRTRERASVPLDENMSFQGSCWFMPMDYFEKLIYPMDEANYGMFIGEPQEIGLKVWLSGGRCLIGKDAWYAHLWKGKPYRELHQKLYGIPYTRVGYHELVKGNAYSTDYWFNNRWPERKHDLEWLVERFWPVPTWPENRELWTRSLTS